MATATKPAAHAPGPWKWFNYPDGRKLLAGVDRGVIHCADAPIAVDLADQNLIAAAPDLLAALKAALKHEEPLDSEPAKWMSLAHRAVGKSEGWLTGDEKPYCVGCDEYFGDDWESLPKHVCQFPDDESFCGDCGAELTDSQTCLNDHSEWGE